MYEKWILQLQYIRFVFKGLEVMKHQIMKIPGSSDPPDPADMKPLEIYQFPVLLQTFHFWRFFRHFWRDFDYFEMCAIDNSMFIARRFFASKRQNKTKGESKLYEVKKTRKSEIVSWRRLTVTWWSFWGVDSMLNRQPRCPSNGKCWNLNPKK